VGKTTDRLAAHNFLGVNNSFPLANCYPQAMTGSLPAWMSVGPNFHVISSV
jgi:hypothetical protein